MASIGPQIPLHLLQERQDKGGKAEKSPDETSQVSSQRVQIQETIVGPEIPSELHSTRLPPAVSGTDSDEDDDYGPALPPDLVSAKPEKRKENPVGPSSSNNTPRIGNMERYDLSSEEEDDDDEYGPMPLPKGVEEGDGINEGVKEFIEKEERRKALIEEAAKPKELKRDEWMLVPPSSSDLLGRLSDPTKLKARQFSRGGSTATRSAPNNLWTETPAEKQQRIADEVSGKRRRAVNADEESSYVGDDEEKRRKKRRDEEIRMEVEKHNKSSRGKSLLEAHESEIKSNKNKENDESEGPPKIWDHSRDMAIGGRLMDEKQRQKIISDARSLGDRFGSGKGGGFL